MAESTKWHDILHRQLRYLRGRLVSPKHATDRGGAIRRTLHSGHTSRRGLGPACESPRALQRRRAPRAAQPLGDPSLNKSWNEKRTKWVGQRRSRGTSRSNSQAQGVIWAPFPESRRRRRDLFLCAAWSFLGVMDLSPSTTNHRNPEWTTRLHHAQTAQSRMLSSTRLLTTITLRQRRLHLRLYDLSPSHRLYHYLQNNPMIRCTRAVTVCRDF